MHSEERTIQIVKAEPSENDQIRYWRVEWNDRGGGEGFVLLFLDSTYCRDIEPRLSEMWTGSEVRALSP
jgi:hypothetical protein